MQSLRITQVSDPTAVSHPSIRRTFPYGFASWACPETTHHLSAGRFPEGARWGRDSGAWSVPSQALEVHVFDGQIRRVHEFCTKCGHRTSALPSLTWQRLQDLGTEIVYKFIHDDRLCMVDGCRNHGTDLHHWAPRAAFGRDEADRWPTAYLCHDHHQLWHRTMCGYQWQAKAVDA